VKIKPAIDLEITLHKRKLEMDKNLTIKA